ncbi:EsaB/YukD family protein, partial [Mycolicibacterium porcinum]
MSSNPIAQEADWIVTLLEPELEAEAEPELSRLTLVVGELNIDVGLPAHVSIAQYIPDVIDIANEQITNQDAIVEFDAADGRWTLAPLGGAPIEPHLSLGEAGVHDGDLLMICAVGQPVSPLLFDDVDDTHAAAAGTVRSWLADKANALAGFGVTAAAAVTLAGVVARWTAQPAVPAAVLALGVTG